MRVDMSGLVARAAGAGEATPLIAEIGTAPITTPEQEQMAAALIRSLGDHVSTWEAEIEVPLKQARDLTEWVRSVYPIRQATAAIGRLRRRITEYRAECERRLQETLPAAANPQEVQQLLSVVTPVPQGFCERGQWHAEVMTSPTDTWARLLGYAKRRADPELVQILFDALDIRFVMVDQKALDAEARRAKDDFRINGAKAVKTTSIARSSNG